MKNALTAATIAAIIALGAGAARADVYDPTQGPCDPTKYLCVAPPPAPPGPFYGDCDRTREVCEPIVDQTLTPRHKHHRHHRHHHRHYR